MVDAQPVDAPHTPESGWFIDGRYRVLSLLGRGGMADVFRAHDEVLGREVAVKVFADHIDTPDAQLRSQLEVRTLAGLSHPNLVTVFDAGVDASERGQERGYLVMELIDGPTVRHRIDTSSVDPTEVAYLGMQVASALNYVHQRDVVHRDIKPANIMLDPTDLGQLSPWTAKLADFGIARPGAAEPLTATGATIGTLSYLSPEQARGERVGPPSDVYSLGLVLLEGLTGTRRSEFGKHRRDSRSWRPGRVPTEYGPAWTHLLTAMLATNPRARPTASEVHTLLAQIVGETTRPTPALFDHLFEPPDRDVFRTTPPRTASPAGVALAGRTRRSRTPVLVLAIVLGALSLLLLATALRSRQIVGTGTAEPVAVTSASTTQHGVPTGSPRRQVPAPAAPTVAPVTKPVTPTSSALPHAGPSARPHPTAAPTSGDGESKGNGSGKHHGHGGRQS